MTERRAVIFDLDGVLLRSEPLWQQGFADVVNAFVVRRGRPDPRLTAPEMRRFEGGRVNDTVRTLLRSLGHGDLAGEQVVSDLTDEVVHHVSERIDHDRDAIAGSVRVVRQLAERGVSLGVASSSAPEFIDAAVARLGLEDLIDVTQSALHLAHGKPHPEVYRLALERLGVTAARAAAVEDSVTGVVAAVRAGLPCVWLRDGDGTDAERLGEVRDALAAQHVDDVDAAVGLVRRISRDLTLEDVAAALGAEDSGAAVGRRSTATVGGRP